MSSSVTLFFPALLPILASGRFNLVVTAGSAERCVPDCSFWILQPDSLQPTQAGWLQTILLMSRVHMSHLAIGAGILLDDGFAKADIFWVCPVPTVDTKSLNFLIIIQMFE